MADVRNADVRNAEVRNWDDFTGLMGDAMKERVQARIARIRKLNEQVPIFGPLVDQTLPQGEDERDGDYDQRRVDLLILAAFTLYSNTRSEGKNVHTFLEYVQSVASTQLIAMGGEPIPEVPDERLKEVSKLLDRELRFGEDYAIALFSINKVAWTTSVKGSLGVNMFELATRGARAQLDDARGGDFASALADIIKNMGKNRPAPESEAEPAHAPTYMDGPNEGGPNDDGGTPTAPRADN